MLDRIKLHVVYGLLLFTVSACSTLGLEKPRDNRDRISYASAIVEDLTDKVKRLYVTKSIDRERALGYRHKLDDAHGYLSSASVFLVDGDLVSMEQRLTLASTILTLLQDELEAKQ